MAADHPRPLEGPHTQRMEATDDLDAAVGVLLGIVIGLAFWFCVILLAVVIS